MEGFLSFFLSFLFQTRLTKASKSEAPLMGQVIISKITDSWYSLASLFHPGIKEELLVIV